MCHLSGRAAGDFATWPLGLRRPPLCALTGGAGAGRQTRTPFSAGFGAADKIRACRRRRRRRRPQKGAGERPLSRESNAMRSLPVTRTHNSRRRQKLAACKFGPSFRETNPNESSHTRPALRAERNIGSGESSQQVSATRAESRERAASPEIAVTRLMRQNERQHCAGRPAGERNWPSPARA